MVEEDRVDFFKIAELVDVDRPRPARLDRLWLRIGDDHPLPVVAVQAAGDLLKEDLHVLRTAPAPDLDRRAASTWWRCHRCCPTRCRGGFNAVGTGEQRPSSQGSER